jgi:hypothetical protein
MTHAITFRKSSAHTQRARPQDEDRASVHQERVLSEQLWCVHIEGLDDFVATMSREAAEREAAAINAYLDSAKENGQAVTRIVRASATVWPFTPAGHARSLETDWHDLQRMPHRQAQARRREGPLSALLQRLKAFVSGAR